MKPRAKLIIQGKPLAQNVKVPLGLKLKKAPGRPKGSQNVKTAPELKPGQDGIEAPEGYEWESWRDVLSRVTKEKDVKGVSRRERIARRAARLAEAGVPWAVEWVANRMDGKAPQAVLVTDARPNPLLRMSDSQLALVLAQVENVDVRESQPESQ